MSRILKEKQEFVCLHINVKTNRLSIHLWSIYGPKLNFIFFYGTCYQETLFYVVT
jgi:hypothetical protein